MSSYSDTEVDRRLANLVRLGVVAAVDLVSEPPSIQVDIGTAQEPQLTDFLPWMTSRAGGTRTWSPPDVNEQVVILSPGGELAQGVVLPGAIFSDLFPANASSQTLDRTTYPDGSVVEYDSAAHHLTVTVGAGQVTVNCATATVNAATSVQLVTPLVHCTQELKVDGKITGTGGMAMSGGASTVTGGLTVDGISSTGHHHTAQGQFAATTAAQA